MARSSALAARPRRPVRASRRRSPTCRRRASTRAASSRWWAASSSCCRTGACSWSTRGPAARPGWRLRGRTNVYRSPNQDTWYDELLISGNRVLVTGYSYREAASEVTVFTIDDNGQLTREATYYISSNDYYDTENYSTRLVNGNLVIYTPLDLTYVDTNARMRWPLVRRWLRDDDRRAVTTMGRRLFDARDIYKPIQTTRAPMVHSVSVCPLGGERRGDELDCRTTAFVGPGQREFFVSTSDIYLWVTPNHWRDADPNQPCPGETPAPTRSPCRRRSIRCRSRARRRGRSTRAASRPTSWRWTRPPRNSAPCSAGTRRAATEGSNARDPLFPRAAEQPRHDAADGAGAQLHRNAQRADRQLRSALHRHARRLWRAQPPRLLSAGRRRRAADGAGDRRAGGAAARLRADRGAARHPAHRAHRRQHRAHRLSRRCRACRCRTSTCAAARA